VRILFVKDALAWPRAAGHDVHGFSMMQALGRLGHEVALLTRAHAQPEALDGLSLAFHVTLDSAVGPTSRARPDVPSDGRSALQGPGPARLAGPTLSPLQERFLSYWGIDRAGIEAVGRTAAHWVADAVVAVGLDGLPYLTGVTGARRVWYAADEAAWHHLSQLRLGSPETWGHARQALINGLYERAFAGHVDRTWVVSAGDRRAMRWLAGMRNVDVIANGVDSDHYEPREEVPFPSSAVFWGRLDFGPNVQALAWFCRKVWPVLRSRAPRARFTVYGRQPNAVVRELASRHGFSLVPDLPDLRPEIARHQVVVLPFVSGGGIKNKLLEAASLGQAIVCTPHACGGLHAGEPLPLVCARSPRQWADAVGGLWADAGRRRQLGAQARLWVRTHHTWEAAARTALAGLDRSSLKETVAPALIQEGSVSASCS
jgi:polysaccharide biosynthesis protein PslH